MPRCRAAAAILLFLGAVVLVPASLTFISSGGSSIRSPAREALLTTPSLETQRFQHVAGSEPRGASTYSILACALVSAALARRAARPAQKSCIARRAEGESLMGGMLGAIKQDQDEEAEQMKEGQAESQRVPSRQEGDAMSQYFDKDIDEGDLEQYMKDYEASQDESLARLTRYDLYPSKQYILYLAKMNARKMWTRDGPDGRNIGCLEVQIAILTERIRNIVLHAREFKPDYVCRVKLTSLVSRRRKFLDKLATKNLDAYMKIREELKIRHVYRLDALIGRLGEYRYAVQNRPRAPGRKTLNRLKKAKRLMSNRLANYLRQGKEHKIIHRTKKKLNARRWVARAYDEAALMVADKPMTTYVDPLNLP
ncbi:rpsO [Symbiodinium natans]|uniref:RpsO protein n=1 Tax=Symbiodinium natans TaxID=878477 RepID=A0A812T2W2_9DINO|nr:rpsO [Symbiodinium natans]